MLWAAFDEFAALDCDDVVDDDVEAGRRGYFRSVNVFEAELAPGRLGADLDVFSRAGRSSSGRRCQDVLTSSSEFIVSRPSVKPFASI
jgi:hypothetical protein